MKLSRKLRGTVLGLFLVASAVTYVACTTANPNYNPQQPVSLTNEPYIADLRINALSNRVEQVATAVSPVNPYAGVTDIAIKWGFGITALVSTLVAGIKNKQLGTTLGALGTMADGVVKAGVGQAVVNHASTTEHFATVASAINAATGANQNSTGGTS